MYRVQTRDLFFLFFYDYCHCAKLSPGNEPKVFRERLRSVTVTIISPPLLFSAIFLYRKRRKKINMESTGTVVVCRMQFSYYTTHTGQEKKGCEKLCFFFFFLTERYVARFIFILPKKKKNHDNYQKIAFRWFSILWRLPTIYKSYHILSFVTLHLFLSFLRRILKSPTNLMDRRFLFLSSGFPPPFYPRYVCV